MGREIRRVPPNWEHPRYTADDAPPRHHSYVGEFRPLFDRPFDPALREWLVEYEQWRAGTHPDQDNTNRHLEYWQWDGGPPDPSSYRPEWPEGSATWWQVYETVSEGTPITPPFATPEELVNWLSENKDFWNHGPQPRERAEAFVKAGWVPSGVFSVATGYLSDFETLDMIRSKEDKGSMMDTESGQTFNNISRCLRKS